MSGGHEIWGGPGLSKKDARAAADALEAIEKKRGRLDTREQLEEFVRAAKPATSPTHHLFEWDDKRAAHSHRLHRAREIIMAVRVVFEARPDARLRAFPILVTQGKQGPYPMQRALEDPNLTSQVLERAKADLVAWDQRYQTLRGVAQLAGVFDVVDKIKAEKPVIKRPKPKSSGDDAHP